MRQTVRDGSFSNNVCEVPPITTLMNGGVGASKSFTVPNNEMWKITQAHVILTSTAAVGDRRMAVSVVGPDNNIVTRVHSATVQAASLVWSYSFFPGASNVSTAVASMPFTLANGTVITLNSGLLQFTLADGTVITLGSASSSVSGEVQVAVPEDFYALPGSTVIFYDSAIINPLLDSLEVLLQYVKIAV